MLPPHILQNYECYIYIMTIFFKVKRLSESINTYIKKGCLEYSLSNFIFFFFKKEKEHQSDSRSEHTLKEKPGCTACKNSLKIVHFK